jgi:hypothetical protein
MCRSIEHNLNPPLQPLLSLAGLLASSFSSPIIVIMQVPNIVFVALAAQAFLTLAFANVEVLLRGRNGKLELHHAAEASGRI